MSAGAIFYLKSTCSRYHNCCQAVVTARVNTVESGLLACSYKGLPQYSLQFLLVCRKATLRPDTLHLSLCAELALAACPMLEQSRHPSLDAVGRHANGSFACLALYCVAGAVLAVAALMGLHNGDLQLLPYAIVAAVLWLGFGGWLLYRSLRPSPGYAQAYHLDAPDYSRMPQPERSTTAQAPWELYAFWGIPGARSLPPTRPAPTVRTVRADSTHAPHASAQAMTCAVLELAARKHQRPTSLFGAYQ